MHGAALLYNLMLAELREREDWIERYRNALANWADRLDLTAAASWSLDDLWLRIEHENHRVREPARLFVRRWRELVVEQRGEIADLSAARDLVRAREMRLKGPQSRFVNRTVRDRWGGRSGTDRIAFRWREASSHIRDLADAD